MFWIEGKTPFGIHVDNKRTEEFLDWYLVKVRRDKVLPGVCFISEGEFQGGEGVTCVHTSQGLALFLIV